VNSTLVGRSLSSVYEPSKVSIVDLPDFDRARVEQSIPARDLDDAYAIVERLRDEAARCATTTPAPTAAATSPPGPPSAVPTTPTPTPAASVPADCLGAGGSGDGS
jgi:PPM family protein phosphatase